MTKLQDNWYAANLAEWKEQTDVKKDDDFTVYELSRKVVLFERRFNHSYAEKHAMLQLLFKNVAQIDFTVSPNKTDIGSELKHTISVNGVERVMADFERYPKNGKYYADALVLYLDTIKHYMTLPFTHQQTIDIMDKLVEENISLECLRFVQRKVHPYTSDVHSFDRTDFVDPERYVGEYKTSKYGPNYTMNIGSTVILTLDTVSEDRPKMIALDVYNCKRIPISLASGLSVPFDMESIKQIMLYNFSLVWKSIREDFVKPHYRASHLDWLVATSLDKPTFCINVDYQPTHWNPELSLTELSWEIHKISQENVLVSSYNPVTDKGLDIADKVLLSVNENNIEDPFIINKLDTHLDKQKNKIVIYIELARRFKLKVERFDGDYKKMIDDYIYRIDKYMRDEYKDRDITHEVYSDHSDACDFLRKELSNAGIQTRKQYVTRIANAAEFAHCSTDMTDGCKKFVQEIIISMI